MKILAISGIRSDYDLLSPLYRKLLKNPHIDLRLLVGGAHLSSKFGNTVDCIEADGIPILSRIESLIDADTASSRLKSASIFLQSSVDVVANWMPNLIVYPGDREEVLIGSMLGAYLEIPTLHFYGGDHTVSGHVDNQVRHAASKMSSAHFVSTQEHKDRLISMGENQERIFVVGSLAVDNFVHHKGFDFDDLISNLKFPFKSKSYALVIFHPEPSERDLAPLHLENIIHALRSKGLSICIGYPNSDPSNQSLIDIIEENRSHGDVFVYKNLNRDVFISIYKNASLLIGNSSSGIAEAATIPLSVINVGKRQRGRFCGDNVIFCDGDSDAIASSIDRTTGDAWKEMLSTVVNPYGDGNSTDKAMALIETIDFQNMLLKTEDPLTQSK